MSKARLVITALFVENQTPSEVAARYGVHRSWVYRLKARYEAEGEAAFEPRSRRPKSSPRATPAATVQLVLDLRKQLTQAGHDAGAETIIWHLHHHHGIDLSRATAHRILVRHDQVTPEPAKRPKSSFIRFTAEQPNETWQSDVTHYRLSGTDSTDSTDGTGGTRGHDVEVITWLDDHSRYALHITAHRRVTARIVLTTFTEAAAQHGYPASTLTDNGMIYTVRFAGGRGGRSMLEHELRRLGIVQKNSRPSHPTTCGKVERFQQTMKNWLHRQADQPTTLAELQTLLDRFRSEYNHERPHRSLEHRATPATAFQARPKATPSSDRSRETHDRVRSDKIDRVGAVTLRHNGRLHHIGVGRTHAGTYVRLLVHDLDITIINAATGEILRELVLDPTRDYQPSGAPKGPTRPQKSTNGPTNP